MNKKNNSHSVAMNLIIATLVTLGLVSAANAQTAAAGSFTDPRDGKNYRTVKIGDQTWMAENLNYETSNSSCYDNDPANCTKYGRLYSWNVAINACQGLGSSWRLPTNADWNSLVQAVGGRKIAGKNLKSKTGWEGDNSCADTHGFSALPGGSRSDNAFLNAGWDGDWWSATGNGGSIQIMLSNHNEVIESDGGSAGTGRFGFSVRCVQGTKSDAGQAEQSSGAAMTESRRGELRVSSPDFLKGGQLTGGRTRANIQRTVMQNMAALRHAFSRRLRDNPNLSGTITVKLSIDEFGRVIFAQMVSSTLNDPELENTVVTRVKSWDFGEINVPGDVTEATYPFTFTQ